MEGGYKFITLDRGQVCVCASDWCKENFSGFEILNQDDGFVILA